MPKVRERAGGSAGDKTPGPELVDCWLVPCLVLRTRSKTLAGLCGLIVRATGGRALHPSSFAPPPKCRSRAAHLLTCHFIQAPFSSTEKMTPRWMGRLNADSSESCPHYG